MADNQPQQQQASNEDFLDKAVDQGLDRAGYSQDRNTVEKISDGLRTGFSKLTGKNIPGEDKGPN